MFRKTEETYSISEFLNRGKNEVKEVKSKKFSKVLIPLAAAPFTHIKGAFAADPTVATNAIASGDMYNKVIQAFNPLVDLIQALSYPIAMIVVLGGSLFIMIGNKEKGFTMMQAAGLGYVLVQLTPLILKILVDAIGTM